MEIYKAIARYSTRDLLLASFALLCIPAHQLLGQSLAAQYVPAASTLAGNGTSGYTGDNGLSSANTVEFHAPASVTYDASGNLYIADTGNNVIRRIDAVTKIITTVAGTGTAGFTGDTGLATAAQLSGPKQVAFDSAGNMYIADTVNNRIREVNAQTGIINTVIGNGTTTAKANVTGTATGIDTANSVVVDAAGDIIFASSTQDQVYMLSATTGLTAKAAGTGSAGSTGDGGPANSATFVGPRFMILDAAGNLYLVDRTRSNIRKITYPNGVIIPTAIIQTIAGSTAAITGYTGDGGLATVATLNTPQGIITDALGNVYIADTGNDAIRMINAHTGIITTIMGTGTAGYTGDGSAALKATLSGEQGLAISPMGDQLVIADTANNVIRVVSINNTFPATAVAAASAAQNISVQATTAGTASTYQLTAGLQADFSVGTATGCPGAMAAAAICKLPVSFTPTAPGVRNASTVLTDSPGNKYILGISGIGNSSAASFLPGTIAAFAGTTAAGSTGDGAAATAATLHTPSGAALDASGNLYIADSANNKVRIVNSTTGVINTFAGTGVAGSTGDGSAATAAQLNAPQYVSLDAAGNLYIADTLNNRIREVSAQTGNIATVAGTGVAGSTGDGAVATAATLNSPYGIAADPNGTLYIADSANNKIRMVNVYTGIISTIAGTGVAGSTGNNVAATTALLNHPNGVALDSAKSIYIADTANNLVRKVSNGIITTIAGTGTAGSTGDGGLATAATLNAPTGVYVDAAGDVYIASSAANTVRLINAATGIITTVTGNGTAGATGNGGAATSAELSSPSSIVGDSFGNYYIADSANNRIARVDSVHPALAFGTVNSGTTSSPQFTTLSNFGNQTLMLSKIAITPAAYQQATGLSTDCTSTTSLLPGASCQLRVTFSPTANGSTPGSVTITDNALNNAASTQTITLTGTGLVVGPPAAIVVSAGNHQTALPLGPFAVLLQALVTDGSGNHVNGASVTFTAPANGATGTFANSTNTVTVTTAANGIATATAFTASGVRGNFIVTASVTSVSTPASFSETIAGNVAPVLSLSLSSASIQYGQPTTATVTLTPSMLNSVSATGTVTLLDGGTSVGSGTVSSGQAVITYALPLAGTHSVTASYSGDSNFSASITSTSASLTVSKLPITITAASSSMPYGSQIPVITGTITGALTQDLPNLVATYTASGTQPLNVGVYTLTGALSGSASGNYAPAYTGSPTLTITQASTTTVVTASPQSVNLGSSVTITASVSSTVSGAPSPIGTVNFFNGTTQLGTANLTSGAASISVSTLPAGAQSVTAVYVGNANNSGSTSIVYTVMVVAPDFAITISPSSATIQQGQRVYVTLTATGNQAYTGTMTFSCSGLPASSSCTFTPATITGSGSSLLEIATAGHSTSASLHMPRSGKGITLAFLCLPVLLGGLASRKKLGRLSLVILPLFVLVCAATFIASLTGCGQSLNTTNTLATPTGTSSISITAQSSSLNHSSTFTLTVVPTP